jgi:hypothetical protein
MASLTVMPRLVLVLCACLASVTATPLQAEVSGGPCYGLEPLLDPALPGGERAQALDSLRLAAKQGSAPAHYLLGTLYRLGPDHPAKLVSRDLEAARRHLGQAALGGQLAAMAALAEIDLKRGAAMDAMVWAQALMHFDRDGQGFTGSSKRAYQASLLDRAYRALGNADRAGTQTDVEEYLGGFLAKHEAGIRAAMARDPAARDGCAPSYDYAQWPLVLASDAKVPIAGNRRTRRPENPGYGLFYIEVMPDGRVGKALVFDGLPGADDAKLLLRTAERLQFNPAPGAPVRSALVPISVDDYSVRLRD